MTTKRMPKPYLVTVDIEPNKSNQFKTKLKLQRIGVAATIEDAKLLIGTDLVQCSQSYSELISPISRKGRTYRIFKATWQEVDSQTY